MNKIFKYLLIFCGLIVSYLLFACFSYFVPEDKIKENVRKSVEMGDISSDYPRAIVNKEVCKMDNCTDALILNQVYCLSDFDLFRSIMLVPSRGDELRGVDDLKEVVYGENTPIQYYSRYWHGSTFLMRFLCYIIGRYANIRLLFFYLSSILIMGVVCSLFQKKGALYSFAFFVSFLLIKGYVLQFSIQFFPVLIIFLVGCLWILHRKSECPPYVCFFVLGSLTAYFDLLTTPLLTWGMPLLIYIIIDNKDVKMLSKEVLFISILWFIGYSGTWFAKWILGSVITGENVIAEGLNVGVYRLSSDVSEGRSSTISVSRWDAILTNVVKLPLGVLGLLFSILLFVVCSKRKKQFVRKTILYLCIGCMPYLWYLSLSNHSIVHNFFTYRTQWLALLALELIFVEHIDLSKRLKLVKN